MSGYKPKIKICGIRDADIALDAAKAGVDLLGLVFVEGVRRQLKVMEGAAVVARYRLRADVRGYRTRFVGLFRNQPRDWVNEVSKRAALDYVQLCGEEDEDYVRGIWRPVLRQIRVRSEMTAAHLEEAASPHLNAGRMVLLDRFDEDTPGGSGKTFDWSKAEGVADKDGVLLAGGLSPDNVEDAIERLRPWGVDVSSGVESGGVKDREKIRAFVAAARGQRVA